MNIHIHGKRTETVYAFTVEYKGEMLRGRRIIVQKQDKDETRPMTVQTTEFDKKPGTFFEYTPCKNPYKDIDDAIADYEKTR